jgi:hypothetical protein
MYPKNSFVNLSKGSHDAGIGNTQMRAFLSSMNSPSMTNRTYEKTEKQVGPKTIAYAESLCQDAILEEKELSKRHL